ncbi:MAG: helix-turn-helix domain-containing protein [Rhizomicrobium sp.]
MRARVTGWPHPDCANCWRESATLRDHLLLFARAFAIQVAHTALANGAGLLEQRLARWLLTLHDRVEGDTLAITHDYIATMLSVRRPGVSVALKVLEEQGLTRVNRGLIAIVDRQGLLEKSAGFYGPTEEEYRRLLNWTPQRG